MWPRPEFRVPAAEHFVQFLVQHLGPRLQQQMGTAQGPLHRLLLDEALTDHLIDGRFDKGDADGFAVPVALAKVGNELAVVPNVDLKRERKSSGAS